MHPKWTSRFEIKPGVWVFVPTEKTVAQGTVLKKMLSERWHAPANYFHLSAGGHIAALQAHIGNDYFAHLDIEGFFASINRTRVTRVLKPYFGYTVARQHAVDATVHVPKRKATMLPFGFVASPILASVCLSKSALGRSLREVKQRHDVTVSVYVDDIVVSSKNHDSVERAVRDLEAAAERSQFKLSASKREGPGERITAFNIELSHNSLVVEPTRWMQFVEAYTRADNDSVRKGIAGYVNSVNQEQASGLNDELVHLR